MMDNEKPVQRYPHLTRLSGFTLVGSGILVIALVFGVNRLILTERSPDASQSKDTILAAANTPTNRSTEAASATVTAEKPTLSPPRHAQVSINKEHDLSSVNLRSCPSVTCAVTGELKIGQQVRAVGRVSDGSWIQVADPSSSAGAAWVYGDLVTVSGDLPPVVLKLPTPTPFLPAIATQACKTTGQIKPLLGYFPEHPIQLIDGGFVQSGDFIFEILLGCDPIFGPKAEEGKLTSNIPGLGVHLVLSYRGSAEIGQILETWGIGGEGVPPMLEGSGSSQSGVIAPGIATQLTGIRIPPELLQSLSRADGIPLEFVYQARNPEGEWSGAVLSFVLVDKPEGFYPKDVSIRPLSAQELSTSVP